MTINLVKTPRSAGLSPRPSSTTGKVINRRPPGSNRQNRACQPTKQAVRRGENTRQKQWIDRHGWACRGPTTSKEPPNGQLASPERTHHDRITAARKGAALHLLKAALQPWHGIRPGGGDGPSPRQPDAPGPGREASAAGSPPRPPGPWCRPLWPPHPRAASARTP